MEPIMKSEWTSMEIHEEAHKRYTQHLAEAMGQTKQILVSRILQQHSWDGADLLSNPHEIKVDFNE